MTINTEEITHILKQLLATSPARFLGVIATHNRPPLNSIQSLVPGCYLSNIDPTGKGGTYWVAFFHTTTNRLEFSRVMEENLVNLGSHFQIPSNIS